MKSQNRPPATAASRLFGRRSALTTSETFVLLLGVVLVWFAGKILLIAFGGVLIAVFLHALAKGLSDRTPLSYGWALAIVVLVLVAIFGGAFLLIGNRLAKQANEFVKAVPDSLQQIRDLLAQTQWGQWILEQSPEWGRAIARGDVPSRITDLASWIFDLAVSLVIMLFIGLYCAGEPKLYTNGLLHLVPIDRRARAAEVLSTVGFNLRWWLMGQLFAMLMVGVITFVGMSIAEVPLALTLAVMAAGLEIIPNVGPLLWLVPAVLVALTQGPHQVANICIIYMLTHLIEGYILIPMVQRRTVLLPPALSILAVLVLGLWGGILGLIVAAPLALVVMLLVKMLYVEDRLGDSLEVPGEPAA